jgi:hypothetical protein
MCTTGSVKVRVDISRKEGTTNFGSNGASVGVEVELHGASSADIENARVHWTSWCADAVDHVLAAQRQDQGGAPAPALPAPAPAHPQPAGPTGRPRSEWGTAYPAAGGPPVAPPARAHGGGTGNGNGDGPPRSGGGLYAKLKDLDEKNPSLRIVRHVANWAKAGGNADRMSGWPSEWVEGGWAEAQRYLEALRKSESLSAGY